MNDNVKVEMLFNLYGHKPGTGFAYSVFDTNGLAPTITTLTGGGRQPHIIEIHDEEMDM